MATLDWLNVFGVAVSIISAVVSIRQARSAKASSQSARDAMAVIQLAAIGERLKTAQEHIRDVAPEKMRERGYKLGGRVTLIRREFDISLSALPKVGHGSTARLLLTKAQTALNGYEESLSSAPDREKWIELQASVQDAISELGSNTAGIGIQK